MKRVKKQKKKLDADTNIFNKQKKVITRRRALQLARLKKNKEIKVSPLMPPFNIECLHSKTKVSLSFECQRRAERERKKVGYLCALPQLLFLLSKHEAPVNFCQCTFAKSAFPISKLR